MENFSKSFSPKKAKLTSLTPSQAHIKLSDLKQYVSWTFSGCMMPALEEFLQIQIKGDECIVPVENQRAIVEKVNQEDTDCWIYYVQQGSVIIRGQVEYEDEQYGDQNGLGFNLAKKPHQSRKQTRKIQVKQGNFFILRNLRNRSSIEQLIIDLSDDYQQEQCRIGTIKIRNEYNFDWYITESAKCIFLAPIFQNINQNLSQFKLKGLSRAFSSSKYSKGTSLTTQSQLANKLIIIYSGQCEYSKSFAYTDSHSNVSINRKLKIAVGDQKAILGAEFVLFGFGGISRLAQIAVQGMNELQIRNQNLKLRMYEDGSCNFTVAVRSAYVEVYEIEIERLKIICGKYLQEIPKNLRANVEGTYVTLLRAAKQKLDLEISKIQRNSAIAKQQKIQMQAKTQAEHLSNRQKIQHSRNLSRSQLSLSHEKTNKKQKQRKIGITLSQQKNEKELKKKIQQVLLSKLNECKLSQFNIESPQKQKLKDDLALIFIGDQRNLRTDSIQRHNEILSQKQQIMRKRYSSLTNLANIYDNHEIGKGKLFRQSMIRRGLSYDSVKQVKAEEENRFSFGLVTQKIKKDCQNKINKANKIRQQFLTIRAGCEDCHCYDDFEGDNHGKMNKDIRDQAMKTGYAWKTASDWKNNDETEPLEKLHSKMKIVSTRISGKYDHNKHILKKRKGLISGSQRRLSSPFI